MKTMICRELGGKCDQKLSADSWEGIIKGGFPLAVPCPQADGACYYQ
jgi:hypothetical protein